MPLHWNSWDDFVDNVHPSMVRVRGLYKVLSNQPTILSIMQMEENRLRLQSALRDLKEMGFNRGDIIHKSISKRKLEDAYTLSLHAIRAGEELLLYYERLARSEAAYGFLHSNDLPEHWDRYLEKGNPSYEIYELFRDASRLLEGFEQMLEDERSFLINRLDLPSDLEADFKLARNLSSAGFEEIALFAAGRGLERVIRTIIKENDVLLKFKESTEPAWETTLNNLIEILYRLRWKASGNRFIDKKVKILLHYLRTNRNEGAHPDFESVYEITAIRETVVIVVDLAQQLWLVYLENSAGFSTNIIEKNWQEHY